MAGAEGGLGGSCFFEGDCEVPLVCEVEGVGGKTLTCKIFLLLIAFFQFMKELASCPAGLWVA